MTVLFPPTSAASIPSASDTVEGKARVATSAEVTTGTDNTTIVTPLTLTQKINATLSGGVEYKGDFNPSSPGTTLNNALKGDLYIIASGVTNVEFPAASGIFWHTGDHLLINTDMGGTLSASKIDKIDSTDSVASVAGKTGPVTLVVSDLTDNSILARLVDPTFTGTPEAPTANLGTSTGQLATTQFVQNQIGAISSGALNDLSDVVITGVANNNLVKYNSGNNQWENGTIHRSEVSGLGTAAQADTGTTAGDVLVFSVNAQLPAVDGSQLTNLPSAPSATATSEGVVQLATSAQVLAGTDATKVVTPQTTKFIPLHNLQNVSYTTPLTQGDVLTVSSTGGWTASAPSGGALSTLTDVTLTSLAGGEFLKYNSSNTAWENVTISSSDVSGLGTAATKDFGTTANKLVELDGSARLPAVDGSQLTGITVDLSSSSIDDLSDVDTTTSAPSNDQLLSWDGSGNWVPATTDITLDTAPVLGGDLNLNQNEILSQSLFIFRPTNNNAPTVLDLYTRSNAIGGGIRLWEPNYSGTNSGTDSYVWLYAPTLSSSYSLKLPNALGSANQFLKIDSVSGTTANLEWSSVTADLSSSSIDDLSDVDTATSAPTSGQLLSWDGSSNWVPATTDITLDTSPVLGGDLDVGTHDIISTSNRNIEIAPNGTGSVKIKGTSSGAGHLVLNCEFNSHGVTIQSPPHSTYSGSYTLTLPGALGSANQFLKIDSVSGTTGSLEWSGPLLAVSENLSEIATAGASAVTAVQQNLDLEPNVDIQAYDAGLQSISGLTTAADKMIYTDGSDSYVVTDLTSQARLLLADASASDQRSTLGLADVAESGDASDVTSAVNPSNYTKTNNNVDGHLSGIDSKLGTIFTLPTYSAITADTTAQLNYHYSIDTTSNAVTLTLPTLNGTTGGQKITVKFKTKGGSNNVTIARDGSDTIDKQTSYTLSVEHSAITLIGDGSSNWEII